MKIPGRGSSTLARIYCGACFEALSSESKVSYMFHKQSMDILLTTGMYVRMVFHMYTHIGELAVPGLLFIPKP